MGASVGIYSLAEFREAVGIVNADQRVVRSALRLETRYRLVAERIDGLARRAGLRSLFTITDDGLCIVTVRGFRRSAPAEVR